MRLQVLDTKTRVQLTAGNLGWAYFQLGDDERALEQFDSAEKIAIQIGNTRSQLKWLTDTGYVYRDLGDSARATQSYRQALDLARQINSKEDILNALEDLALVSVLDGKLDEADAAIARLKLVEADDGIRPERHFAFDHGSAGSRARTILASGEEFPLGLRMILRRW